MIEFLDWIARVGGLVAILLTILGFMFREKWKQILQRSLSEDLERLKDSLVKSQAEHAASLTPQLEQIKHDFQQKMEAYKVSLIAQTEQVKAKSELKKTIALRYTEIEFERLIKLEKILSSISANVCGFALIDVANKSDENLTRANEIYEEYVISQLEAGMFFSTEHNEEFIKLRSTILDVIHQNIGHLKPSLTFQDQKIVSMLSLSSSLHNKIISRIKSLGEF